MFVIKIENIYNQHEPILVQCDQFEVWEGMVKCWDEGVSSGLAKPVFAYVLCHGDIVEAFLCEDVSECDIPVHVVH